MLGAQLAPSKIVGSNDALVPCGVTRRFESQAIHLAQGEFNFLIGERKIVTVRVFF